MVNRLVRATLLLALSCSPQLDDEAGDEFSDTDRLTDSALASAPEAKAPLTFKRSCDGTSTLSVVAVGDVLPHSPLQKQAYAIDDGFRSLWRSVAPNLARADLTYGNLEGPTAAGVAARGKPAPDPGKSYDNHVYSSFPLFNYHPSLITDLKGAGFDVLSTANNHALDRGPLGVDRTIDALAASGVSFTGTVRQTERGAWFTVTETKDYRLAFVACAFGVNGNPDPYGQTLRCYDVPNEGVIEGPPNQALLDLTRDLAQRSDLDGVIVTPHWGTENVFQPRRTQMVLGRALIDAGATAVLGAHPHVLEPWEKHTTADGREGFIIYSLGNFVSGQAKYEQRSAILLDVELGKVSGQKAFVRRVGHLPLYMSRKDGVIGVRPAEDRGDAKGAYDLATRIFGAANRLSPGQSVTDLPCR